MKRAFTITALVTVALGIATVLLVLPILAMTPESEELTVPSLSSEPILVGTPSVLTLTSLLPDSKIKSPQIQYFDTVKSKWKQLGKMRDDGKFGDTTADDRIFTLKIQVLDSGTSTRLSIFERTLREKATVPSPAQIRLVARKKGQLGKVVSPPITLEAWKTLATPDIGVTVSYPPNLFALRDPRNPAQELIQTSPKEIILGGALPEDPAASYVTDGYVVGISSTSYTQPFDITQWLSTAHPSSPLYTVSNRTVSGLASFRVTFRDEIGEGEPITIIPFSGRVIEISYSSTFAAGSPLEVRGLEIYDHIVQSLQVQ